MKSKLVTYSAQSIDNQDIQSVVKILKSPFLTQGPKVPEFEKKLQKIAQSRYVAVVNSGTAALHIACLAIGIKKGDEVITSPLSFVATANAATYCGGKPIFADVDEYGLLNPEEVERKISKKTKAVITVDYAGQPSYVQQLKELCRKYNLILISDAAHSLGAMDGKNPVGSLADLTCFSFHPVKTITTIEGGAIATQNYIYYQKIVMLRNHGITKNRDLFVSKDQGDWYYEMQTLGYNFRMSDVEATLGISQLTKIRKFIKRRNQIAQLYIKHLKIMEQRYQLIIPKLRKGILSAWHLFPLRIDFSQKKISRKRFFEMFLKHGIKLQVHYIPIHLQPYYVNKFHYQRGDFPKSELFYDQEVSLPIYPNLSDREVYRIIRLIQKYVCNFK